MKGKFNISQSPYEEFHTQMKNAKVQKKYKDMQKIFNETKKNQKKAKTQINSKAATMYETTTN
jgi:hypothetical protein